MKPCSADPLIFLDTLVDILADESRLRDKDAIGALNIFAETLPCKEERCLTISEFWRTLTKHHWQHAPLIGKGERHEQLTFFGLEVGVARREKGRAWLEDEGEKFD
ncbi:hypothetical protein VNO77_34300 [Canavalia gladiata]|uniref:Uncharacterized protein n=1 Tax=Canavalia gladiata TaxID=3824 RepID=A0AAN9KDD0_CANGL